MEVIYLKLLICNASEPAAEAHPVYTLAGSL